MNNNNNDNDSNTLLKNRREVIGLLGAGTTISIAGCSSSQGTSEETAEETAQSYLEAKYSGDYEQAKSYTSGLEHDRIDESDIRTIQEGSTEFVSINNIDKVDSEIDTLKSEAKVEYEDEILSGVSTQRRELILYLIQKDEGWKVVKDTNEAEDGHVNADDAHEFDQSIEGSLANIGVEFVQGLHTNPEKSRDLSEERDPVMNSIDRFHEDIEDHELESLQLESIEIRQDMSSVRLTAEHEPTYLSREYDFPLGIEDGKVVRAWRV